MSTTSAERKLTYFNYKKQKSQTNFDIQKGEAEKAP